MEELFAERGRLVGLFLTAAGSDRLQQCSRVVDFCGGQGLSSVCGQRHQAGLRII